MIIYLDESKRLSKGQIVFGGFMIDHNTAYISKLIRKLKKDFQIKDHIELKSINKYGEKFIRNFHKTSDYIDLDIKTFGFCFNNYTDSIENYKKILLQTIKIIYPYINYYKQDIIIVADKITIKDTNKVQKEIENLVKTSFNIKGKLTFNFENSKNYHGLQLADLIVGKYKEFYFFDDIEYLDDFVGDKKIDIFTFDKNCYFKA